MAQKKKHKKPKKEKENETNKKKKNKMLGMAQALCSLLKVHKTYLKQHINNSASFTSN